MVNFHETDRLNVIAGLGHKSSIYWSCSFWSAFEIFISIKEMLSQ